MPSQPLSNAAQLSSRIIGLAWTNGDFVTLADLYIAYQRRSTRFTSVTKQALLFAPGEQLLT